VGFLYVGLMSLFQGRFHRRAAEAPQAAETEAVEAEAA
jgi:hypothetical protein